MTAAAADALAAAAAPRRPGPRAASALPLPVDESADGATAPTRMCVVTWNAGEAEVNKRAIKQTCDAIGMNDCRILATRKDKQKENRLVVLFNSVEAARCFAEKYAEWCPDGRKASDGWEVEWAGAARLTKVDDEAPAEAKADAPVVPPAPARARLAAPPSRRSR